jgi:hypothetical protein
MDSFRAPFFWLAVVALALAVLVEAASVAIVHVPAVQSAVASSTPGWGIRYLLILDFALAYGVGVIAAGLLLPRSVVGRLQGIVALVLSFLGCLGTIGLAILALTLLVLMVTLLLAVPFGTIAYLVAWGTFPTGSAEATLALLMFLKIVFIVLLILAEQRFLKNKGLMIISGLSLGATWLVAFLIGFPPSPLASIADVIGALVIAIVGIIWLLLLFIGSLLATFAALKSVRA